MIYIVVDENDNVTTQHFMPFDEKHGLGKSKEELEAHGFFVEKLPVPLQEQNQEAILKGSYASKTVWFEYVPKQLTRDEEIEQLKQDLGNILFESAADKAKITELEAAQGDLLMELATLKMGGSV
ncbi:hypothetical protein IIE26_05225 [Cytobacillus oceanisediminis]|uniref:hypothetical protein n=1 Tax=Cytobacillus oceanisediminis TaxID=665099 RepID=UPI00186443E6|nr:hypothetical protein [Cytobacillus oceanisediminis]QOK28071.1 hypothetical protein IIE26_05225 [Cytobacillus oceanisediminis]